MLSTNDFCNFSFCSSALNFHQERPRSEILAMSSEDVAMLDSDDYNTQGEM
jgi:hypothetical protein